MPKLPSTNPDMGRQEQPIQRGNQLQRPSWDEYFTEILEAVRKRSTCLRAQHSALVVRDNRIISEGYNGSVAGQPHCTDVGCLIVDNHCKRTTHAESNAILYAAKNGVALHYSTLYVTGMPCLDCVKDIESVGIYDIRIADIEKYTNYQPEEQKAWEEITKGMEVTWLVS